MAKWYLAVATIILAVYSDLQQYDVLLNCCNLVLVCESIDWRQPFLTRGDDPVLLRLLRNDGMVHDLCAFIICSYEDYSSS